MIALLNCCVLETCLLSNVYTKYTADVRICCMICSTILIIAFAGMISVCIYKWIESYFKVKEAQKKNEHDKDEVKTKLTKDILDKYLDQYLVILKKKGELVAQRAGNQNTQDSKLPSESQYEKILATLVVAAMRGDMEKLELDGNFEIVLPKLVERNKGENQ